MLMMITTVLINKEITTETSNKKKCISKTTIDKKSAYKNACLRLHISSDIFAQNTNLKSIKKAIQKLNIQAISHA